MLDRAAERFLSFPPDMLEYTDEKLRCAQHTIAYWREAHQDDTPYHQRFPGYCWFCTNLPIDYLRTVKNPEWSQS